MVKGKNNKIMKKTELILDVLFQISLCVFVSTVNWSDPRGRQ